MEQHYGTAAAARRLGIATQKLIYHAHRGRVPGVELPSGKPAWPESALDRFASEYLGTASAETSWALRAMELFLIDGPYLKLAVDLSDPAQLALAAEFLVSLHWRPKQVGPLAPEDLPLATAVALKKSAERLVVSAERSSDAITLIAGDLSARDLERQIGVWRAAGYEVTRIVALCGRVPYGLGAPTLILSGELGAPKRSVELTVVPGA